jgi:hypothetical protein
MSLTRLAQLAAATRTTLALIVLSALVAACNSSSTSVGFSVPAKVRIVNALIDASAIDVVVYQDPLVTNLPFEGITQYLSVDSGNREIKISIAGGTSTIYDASTLLVDAGSYTFVVYGTTAAPGVQVLTDALVQAQPPAAGTFRLRMINAAADTAAFDAYVTPPGGSLASLSPNFSDVAYGRASAFVAITSGNLQVRFTKVGSKEVVYDSGTIAFNDRTAYQIVGYTRGSSTLVNGALLVNDTTGASSIANSLLAQFKLVHAAPGTAAITAFFDGSVAFANVPFENATSYEAQSSGTHTVTIETVTSPGAVIASAQPTFVPATDSSFIVTGPPGAQTAVVLADSNLRGTAGNARVRFVNVAVDQSSVDVLVNFAKQVSALGNNTASSYVEELEDTYTIGFQTSGTTRLLTSTPSVLLTAGHTYTMYLVGTAGQYNTVLTRDD